MLRLYQKVKGTFQKIDAMCDWLEDTQTTGIVGGFTPESLASTVLALACITPGTILSGMAPLRNEKEIDSRLQSARRMPLDSTYVDPCLITGCAKTQLPHLRTLESWDLESRCKTATHLHSALQADTCCSIPLTTRNYI